MKTAQARVSTDRASRYLQQPAKRFVHKVPAEYMLDCGRIESPVGLRMLAARDSESLVGGPGTRPEIVWRCAG